MEFIESLLQKQENKAFSNLRDSLFENLKNKNKIHYKVAKTNKYGVKICCFKLVFEFLEPGKDNLTTFLMLNKTFNKNLKKKIYLQYLSLPNKILRKIRFKIWISFMKPVEKKIIIYIYYNLVFR